MSGFGLAGEKRPRGREWQEVRDARGLAIARARGDLGYSAWSDGLVLVTSGLHVAEAPDGRGDAIPQWHISFSRGNGKRAKPHDARRVLRAFDMVGAEEDNHEPGAARHFWLPLDPTRRVDCHCKTDETVIVDERGHKWSCAVDAKDCGGCAYDRMMQAIGRGPRPCPKHASDDATQEAL